MSYSEYDVSVQNADPVFLFHFVYESTNYRFTNGAENVTALSETWLSNNLEPSDFKQSSDITKDNLNIDFPIDDSFAALFLSGIQESITTLTVYRGFLSDPDSEFIVYWKGRASQTKTSSNKISIECEPIFTSLRRPGMRSRYQRTCRHSLYGRGCGLDPESSSFVVEDIVSEVSGLVLTVNSASLQPDGYYNGGMIKTSSGVHRFIRSHVGSLITLTYAYDGFVESDSVRLYPGCNRTTDDCLNKFNNLDNYGGFPFIPTKNPFGGSSII